MSVSGSSQLVSSADAHQSIFDMIASWNDSAQDCVLPRMEEIEGEPQAEKLARRRLHLTDVAQVTRLSVENRTFALLIQVVECLIADTNRVLLSLALEPDRANKKDFFNSLNAMLAFSHEPLTLFFIEHYEKPAVASLFSILLKELAFYKNFKFLTSNITLKILRSDHQDLIGLLSDKSCDASSITHLSTNLNPWFNAVSLLDDYSGAEMGVLTVLNHPAFNVLQYLDGASRRVFRHLPGVQFKREIWLCLPAEDYVHPRKRSYSIDSDVSSTSNLGSSSGRAEKRALKLAAKIDGSPQAEYREAIYGDIKFIRALLIELCEDYNDKIENTPIAQDGHRMLIKRDFILWLLNELKPEAPSQLWSKSSNDLVALDTVFKLTYIPWYIAQNNHQKAQATTKESLLTSQVWGDYENLTDAQVLEIFQSSKVREKSLNPLGFWLAELFHGKMLMTMVGRLPFHVRKKILEPVQASLPDKVKRLLHASYSRLDEMKNEIQRLTNKYNNDTVTNVTIGNEKTAEPVRRKSFFEQGAAVISSTKKSISSAATDLFDHSRRRNIKMGILDFLSTNLEALWKGEYKSDQLPMVEIIIEHYVPEKKYAREVWNDLQKNHQVAEAKRIKKEIAVWRESHPDQKIPREMQAFNVLNEKNVSLDVFRKIFVESGDEEKKNDPLNAITKEALIGHELKALLLDFPKHVLKALFKGVNIELDTLQVTVKMAASEQTLNAEALSSLGNSAVGLSTVGHYSDRSPFNTNQPYDGCSHHSESPQGSKG